MPLLANGHCMFPQKIKKVQWLINNPKSPFLFHFQKLPYGKVFSNFLKLRNSFLPKGKYTPLHHLWTLLIFSSNLSCKSGHLHVKKSKKLIFSKIPPQKFFILLLEFNTNLLCMKIHTSFLGTLFFPFWASWNTVIWWSKELLIFK